MAYSELIKQFNKIRDYMREFYVYGFKNRDEYTDKSSRSYDDEKRRLESWLGDHMRFRTTAEGKNVFLSIDSRSSRHNPLFKAWKTKSFTDKDITLHFILFDILSSSTESFSLNEIIDSLDAYLADFDDPLSYDASTVRKKLKEYQDEGLVVSEKKGKIMYYRRAETADVSAPDAVDFFSEAAPCGVIGSFILDKLDEHSSTFVFKHHYITGTMDSEIVCTLFDAMHQKSFVTIENANRYKNKTSVIKVVPLRIMISAQSGRQYLMAYAPAFRRIVPFRTDNIVSVTIEDVCSDFDSKRELLNGMKEHLWGVSTQSRSGSFLDHVEFTVCYDEHEKHIPQRLEREKRCGVVEETDECHSRFSADVFDASELVPWIRTFICRITEFSCSDKELEAQFRQDIEKMYDLYGIKEADANVIQ